MLSDQEEFIAGLRAKISHREADLATARAQLAAVAALAERWEQRFPYSTPAEQLRAVLTDPAAAIAAVRAEALREAANAYRIGDSIPWARNARTYLRARADRIEADQ